MEKNNELIVNISQSEISLALLEDKQLVELHKEKSNRQFTVGDIYIAKVKKIMNGLNAAFVDVGYERDAFLHYLDLGPQFLSQQKYLYAALANSKQITPVSKFKTQPDINKHGKISEVIEAGKLVIVQIAKEPISTKGPRLSSEISIAGRNLVLIPFANKVSVSQKIKSAEERNRLQKLIESIRPENYGVIVRTVAKNRRVADLHEELNELSERWERAFSQLHTVEPPQLFVGEINRVSSVLRDVMSTSFTSIHVNNETAYREIRDYMGQIAPDQQKIVKHYTGRTDIFEHFDIFKQIKSSFGKTVTMKSGAYLIIEQTEAMTIIDVNSGNRSKKVDDQETNALEVNLLSAEEISRQLRLRDIGGLIVIDYIDMYKQSNKRALFQKMRDEMDRDRAKHSILPLSKFGLMEITRQRVRPATAIETRETCPVCDGTGEITPSILFIDELENHLRYLIEKSKGSITIATHPYIAGYLKQGFKSKIRLWMLKYKRRLHVKPVITYSFLEFNFYNSEGEKLII